MKVVKSFFTRLGYLGVVQTACYPAEWYAGFYDRNHEGAVALRDNSTPNFYRTFAEAEDAINRELNSLTS